MKVWRPSSSGCRTWAPRGPREYRPFRDDRLGGGHGDAYLRFLTDTLKPLVDAQFRTRREPEHTGMAGHRWVD